MLGGKYSAQAVISAVQSERRLRAERAMFDATSAAVKPRLMAVASSPNSPKTCAVVFPAVMGLPLRDCPMGRRAPPDFARYTGLPNHTRLIKTDDFQARSSTALEAAM